MALAATYRGEGVTSSAETNGHDAMIRALVDRYRCPEDFLHLELIGKLSTDSGYFRFGSKAISYGRTATGYRTSHADALLYAALPDIKSKGSTVLLPFNPSEVIDNLRLERYISGSRPSEWTWKRRALREAYYYLRPMMGVGVRKYLQRLNASGWDKVPFPQWPVDTSVERLSEALLAAAMKAKRVDRIPFVWFWPRGAKSCVVMTHDVEAQKGYDFCQDLMDMDDAYDFKASFQIVPEGDYQISDQVIREIRARGFEVNVQDLNHDGYLFTDREEFVRRANKINHYGRMYGASGFRAAVLYRNPEWYEELDFAYDMSIPNVAHLDPQRGGCCTVTPYFVGNILEIPLTTTQDYTLFHLLDDYSLDLWKMQARAILARNGLLSFLVHPDYVIEKKARNLYHEMLGWLRGLAEQKSLWCALPGEVDQWWRSRSEMRVVSHRGGWRIEGAGSERAVFAYAKLTDGHVEYEIGAGSQTIGDQYPRTADELS
jgi:hypothetical protein